MITESGRRYLLNHSVTTSSFQNFAYVISSSTSTSSVTASSVVVTSESSAVAYKIEATFVQPATDNGTIKYDEFKISDSSTVIARIQLPNIQFRTYQQISNASTTAPSSYTSYGATNIQIKYNFYF